jgi:hypothetical protein
MAKSSRRKQSYRKNASKLHQAIGDLLRLSKLFSSYRIYQEYPVNLVDPTFHSGKERYDWVILDLQVAIEAHGKQHYEPSTFGGITKEEAESKFRRQIYQDNIKHEAAIKAGWKYIIFRYDEEITEESLLNKLEN